MRLIGPVTSPYVRRTAITLELLNQSFELEQLSLFQDWEQFRAINPVVKGPTLVCDGGEVLMDSSLILQYVGSLADSNLALWPELDRTRHFRIVGLALAACEKSVQMVYELRLRPESARLQSWMDRVKVQALAALEGLEVECRQLDETFFQDFSHASIAASVAWEFIGRTLPDLVDAANYPSLLTLSESMEASEVFKRYSPGVG